MNDTIERVTSPDSDGVAQDAVLPLADEINCASESSEPAKTALAKIIVPTDDNLITSKICIYGNIAVLIIAVLLCIIGSILYEAEFYEKITHEDGWTSIRWANTAFLLAAPIIVQLVVGFWIWVVRGVVSIFSMITVSMRADLYRNIVNSVWIIVMLIVLTYSISMFLHLSLDINFFYLPDFNEIMVA